MKYFFNKIILVKKTQQIATIKNLVQHTRTI